MKIFKLNILLSALILALTQNNYSVLASDDDEGFCGLSKGFLNKPKKTIKTEEKKKKLPIKKEKPIKHDFWEDPRYSPEKNLRSTTVINLWENSKKYRLEREVFPKESSTLRQEDALPIIYQFLIAFHSSESDVFRKINTASNVNEIPANIYSFLIEGDRIIRFLLQSSEATRLLSPDSTERQFALVLDEEHWKKYEKIYNAGNVYKSVMAPSYSYYSYYDSKANLRYALYDSKRLKKFKFGAKSYFWGEGLENLIAGANSSEKPSGLRLARNTFILDENKKLVPPRGQLSILLGSHFELDVTTHAYVQDPKTGMPYFVQMSERPENFFETSDDLELLINMVSDRKTLEKQKLLFSDFFIFSSEAQSNFESPGDDVLTPNQAITFLKYALPMLKMYEESPQEIALNEESVSDNSMKELLIEAVENANQVLLENHYRDSFDKEIEVVESRNVEAELGSQDFEKAINEDINEYKTTRSKSNPDEDPQKLKKVLKRKKKQLKEKHMKALLEKQKKKSVLEARENVYKLIHDEILEDLKGKRHLSTSQMKDCLGRLVNHFIQSSDTPLSIDSHVMRGDHGGTKVINLVSGHKETVSLGLRPQKTGYKVGTARKIIGDNFEKLLNLALKRNSLE